MNSSKETPLYLDTTLSFRERAADLVSRMTLEEKVQQMLHEAPAIDRLDVPAYNWWNECLHGVGRAGLATVFPQAIGLAATWNESLLGSVAEAISDEARAKHHDALRNGRVGEQYLGLSYWSPNINIFRDPRWGRGQETYGEDPHLTSRLAVRFIHGLQGNDPRYLKLAACAKHYAVHSGPEHERHRFDAVTSQKDLWETYLPAFEVTVREASVESVMGAYNRTNGEACCASPTLLQQILRDGWGFDGHVVSDCWAIVDIYKHHKLVDTAAEAAALAVNAGCDLNCGSTYGALTDAVEQGLISEATIDRSVERLMMTRFRLGMFDPLSSCAYTQIPMDVVDCEAHRALSLQSARESMVLLKNAGEFLPLKTDLQRIAVIGPNADDSDTLLGNYNGLPSYTITPLQGIRDRAGTNVEVLYARGCPVNRADNAGFDEALEVARKADVVVFVGGLSQLLEGEEGQHESVPEGEQSQGDRVDLDLPRIQEDLLRAVYETGTPIVLVLINGSALAVKWADEHLPAILEAWYPGQDGGTAIAEVLFGDYNPGGRLPVTFYRSHEALPDFNDYRMQGRTYRYFEGEPLYPFGYGLSYTTFAYSNLNITYQQENIGETISVHVDVENTGHLAGDEVVQLYLRDVTASVPVPRHTLQGFKRVYLQPGERRTVHFTLTPRQYALIDEEGQRVVEPGEFEITMGGGQPDFAPDFVAGRFSIGGAPA